MIAAAQPFAAEMLLEGLGAAVYRTDAPLRNLLEIVARLTGAPELTIAAGRSHTAETLLRAWFEDKAEHTFRSYQHDPKDFALYFSRALGSRRRSR